MFGIKEWYLSVIHGIVGVDAGPGGITFYPYSGEEMKLLGFNHMGKQFDIEMKGSGKYISEINVDGVKYTGTNILPADACENIENKRIKVSVLRTSQMQWATFIKSGYGIELKNYSFKKGKIKATIGGLGTCNLKIHSETDPVISLDGVKVPVKYYPELHLAILRVVFEKNQKKEIEIMSQK
jgi:hypothetical protein